MKSRAPSWMAFMIYSCCPRAEHITTTALGSLLRICRSASSPFITGIVKMQIGSVPIGHRMSNVTADVAHRRTYEMKEKNQ